MEMISRAKLFSDLGYDVLLYDARGCGESGGNMVSLGYFETEDLVSAIKYLTDKGKNDIAVYGYSQWGATVILAADKLNSVKCIISEACFDKLENAIDNRFRKYLFIPGNLGTVFMRPEAEKELGINIERIQPVVKIKNIKVPVFIIAADNDTRTTIEKLSGVVWSCK